MIYALITTFIIGYAIIALEHPLKINKTATALILGALVWTFCAVGGQYSHEHLIEHLGDTAEILFFLLGAMTIVGKTDGLNMLYGREDACVLWDIRIADAYKHNGIGQKLLDMGVLNAKKDGYQQMIIECQNNNVPACKFYQKQGAVLSKIDMYAYYSEPEIRNEIQFIWYLDI